MKKRIVVITLLLAFVFVSVAIAQPNCVTKSGYIASVSEELFDKAVSYAVQKDYVALQKLLDSKLVFMLKAGVPVYLEDTKMFSGKVKIRPAVSTVSVWTNIEAVDCK